MNNYYFTISKWYGPLPDDYEYSFYDLFVKNKFPSGPSLIPQFAGMIKEEGVDFEFHQQLEGINGHSITIKIAHPMPTEHELKTKKARELVAAGGCFALSLWSLTDAERLCPEEYYEPMKDHFYTNEWSETARKAIGLIQSGIDLIEDDDQIKESDFTQQDLWKDVVFTVLKSGSRAIEEYNTTGFYYADMIVESIYQYLENNYTIIKKNKKHE